MYKHSPAALALPIGDAIGLESEISDEVRQNQTPEDINR